MSDLISLFIFHCIAIRQCQHRPMQITIWDYVRYGANDFLGEVLLELGCHPLDDEAEWYTLHGHQESNLHTVCITIRFHDIPNLQYCFQIIHVSCSFVDSYVRVIFFRFRPGLILVWFSLSLVCSFNYNSLTLILVSVNSTFLASIENAPFATTYIQSLT